MSLDWSVGAVPPYYREVYDNLCPNDDCRVDQQVFNKLLENTKLPKQTLLQIWDSVDAKQGYLSRTNFYKALALVAFAQQGKGINVKLLEGYSCEELPKPSLGELSEIKSITSDMQNEKNPRLINMTYKQIVAFDNIRVVQVPEKKGMFLKHVVYEVSSQKHRSSVQRRYSDFVALYEILVQKYPYRAVSQIPPKKAMADSQFIEERRKALKRFLMLTCRHPVLCKDSALHFFLTFSGTDIQTRVKEQFKNLPDEFLTSDLAEKSNELVSPDSTVQFAIAREQLRQIYSSVSHIKELVERLVERSKESAVDMLLFGKELSTLSAIPSLESDWGTGGNKCWNFFQHGLKSLHNLFIPLHEANCKQSLIEEEEILEELNLFLDMLLAYKDLCDRHESGVVQGHHKAINRMVKKSTNLAGSPVDPMKQAQQLEHRTQFSLHCVHLETQLVYAYMEILINVLQSLVFVESSGHFQLNELWEKMRPAVANMIPNINGSQ